jgi:hypothetical protein
MRVPLTLRLAGLLALATMGCGRQGLLPDGSWTLRGHGIQGGLEVEDAKVRVLLQGEAWSTAPEGAWAAVRQEDDGTWLSFPVQTAAGEAAAAMSLSIEHGSAQLPLGFREGEHVYALKLEPGEVSPISPPAGLDTLQQAWREGGFSLWDGEELAGAIQLLPGEEARVQLITPSALTDGAAVALRKSEGPDVLLAFPVQPRFADELGLLRLNLPTMRAVLPVDRAPHPDDRKLTVTPGLPSPAQLERRGEAVRERALKDERELLIRLAMELSGAALALRNTGGSCPAPSQLEPDWKLLLADYRLRVEQSPGDCVIHLEPQLVQHTRRTAITATAQGVIELEVLGVD